MFHWVDFGRLLVCHKDSYYEYFDTKMISVAIFFWVKVHIDWTIYRYISFLENMYLSH